MTNTPEQTLLDLIQQFGWTSWEIGLGDSQEHDLGNGLSVSGLNHECTVRADSTEIAGCRYDLHGSGLDQFTNVSARHTGQYGGPDSLHDSESLSAGMLSQYMQPGEYAIAFLDWECGGNDDHYMEELPADFDHDECETTPEGWLFLTNERDYFTVRAHYDGELTRDLHLTEDDSEAYSVMDDWLEEYAGQSGVTVDVYNQNGDVLAGESIA